MQSKPETMSNDTSHKKKQYLHFALKLVSVKLSAFALVLPTLNFGFYVSVSSGDMKGEKLANLKIFFLFFLLAHR